MKSNLILLLFLNLALVLNAQKVKLKDDKVLLDGVSVLKYELRDYKTEIYLFELDKAEESVFIQFHNNETNDISDDNYLKIHFLDLDLKMETSNASGSWKYTVSWLLENKILGADGKFDAEKIELFIKKYDENITERTIRLN